MNEQKVEKNKKVGIGNVLKSIRLIRDITIKELADSMGVSAAYISEVELNNKNPSLEMLTKFSDALSVSKSAIMYFDEQAETHNYEHKMLLYEILCQILNKQNCVDG